MKSFFLYLCLVVLWTVSASSVNPIITQDPYPVTFGGIVKVICNATEHAKLQWKASDETVLEPDGPGVKGISFEGLVSTLKVDVSSFHGRMVSCGVENENATWKSYNICVSWGVVHPPQNITVHGTDTSPKTMSCLVVEDCMDSPNPWFYQNGTQVVNDTANEITVTHESVYDTSRVVEWKLQFADLTKNVFRDYTCRTPSRNATATLKKAATPYIKIPPQNVTVQEGLNSSMTCVVAGDYDSTKTPCSWTHNEKEVKNGSGVTVQGPLIGNDMAVFWLTFTNVTNENIFGDYTCGIGADSKATATLKKGSPVDPSPTKSSTCPALSTTPATSTESSAPPTPSPTSEPVEHCNSSPLDLLGIHQLVNVTYQSPDSNDTESVNIPFESTVNVSCITNCSSNGTVTLVDVYPLSWPTGDNRGAVLTVNDSGVVNISVMEKSNNSASRMLQLRASVINGTKWPKPFKCAAKVRLPDGDEFIRYGKTFSVDFTIPLKVTTVPQSGETVQVKVGEEYRISCNVTGDEAPTDNPWLHSNKTKVKSDTEGVTVIMAPLQDTIGINSTITFIHVTEGQLGDYICSAGDGKPNATVTLKVPLTVTTDPQSGETVKVKVGEEYQISCNVTGDEAPTDNPWLHSNKTKVKSDTKAGVTVIIAPLQDTIGISSTITFIHVTEGQLGDYICSAGDGKPSATVTLKEDGTSGGPDESNEPNSTPTASPGQGSVGIAAVAVAIVVVLVLGGVVFMVYWKRHMLRDWLMEKDVVKVMKKGKRGKGYKYSKLPRDISTSMKHLE